VVKRGLVGVQLAISDAHGGLKTASAIFPDDLSLIRLAGMLCIEQRDVWLVGRAYVSAESISLVLAGPDDHPPKENKKEAPELQAA
jgi:hypothetical protein